MEQNTLPTMQSHVFAPAVKNEKEITVPTGPPSRRHRSFATAFTAVAFLYLCFSISKPFLFSTRISHFEQPSPSSSSWNHPVMASKPLVPLEAHIMSKCSDAKACLKELVLPTMQRVSTKVNFTLSYIGTPTANDGVDCMHGAEECMGNIIELCAAHLYRGEPRIWLGFVMCLSRNYQDIPGQELVEDCALEHGIDFNMLNDCSSSDDGFAIGLLRDSVTRSRNAGVTTSCTVRLNEEIYCIHDGGEWKDCPHGPGVNDLVIEIEKLYNSS